HGSDRGTGNRKDENSDSQDTVSSGNPQGEALGDHRGYLYQSRGKRTERKTGTCRGGREKPVAAPGGNVPWDLSGTAEEQRQQGPDGPGGGKKGDRRRNRPGVWTRPAGEGASAGGCPLENGRRHRRSSEGDRERRGFL